MEPLHNHSLVQLCISFFASFSLNILLVSFFLLLPSIFFNFWISGPVTASFSFFNFAFTTANSKYVHFKCSLPGLFFTFFLLFQQLAVPKQVQYEFCQWLDLCRGPIVSEATSLPIEPKPLPIIERLLHWPLLSLFLSLSLSFSFFLSQLFSLSHAVWSFSLAHSLKNVWTFLVPQKHPFIYLTMFKDWNVRELVKLCGPHQLIRLPYLRLVQTSYKSAVTSNWRSPLQGK